MPTPINVRALCFDVFGTVVDWRTSVAREAARFLAPRQLDWLAFADAWRARYQPAMKVVREGGRGFVILDVLHREMLEATLEEFGLRDLSEAERAELNFAWHRLDPWPDTVEGLTRLKRKMILATLSNGNVRLMVDMAKNAGLPWDVILGAESARDYKPAPAVYDDAARKLLLDPSECMMVAAHSEDLRAAAARGFKTAYVYRPLEFGARRERKRPPKEAFDIQAEDFNDLADKLGC